MFLCFVFLVFNSRWELNLLGVFGYGDNFSVAGDPLVNKGYFRQYFKSTVRHNISMILSINSF